MYHELAAMSNYFRLPTEQVNNAFVMRMPRVTIFLHSKAYTAVRDHRRRGVTEYNALNDPRVGVVYFAMRPLCRRGRS